MNVAAILIERISTLANIDLTVNSTNNYSKELETSFVPATLKHHLSSHPNWIIGDPVEEEYAAILWIDVCDFSPLCNRLMKEPVKGVEKITQILQSHYDFLLKTVTEQGGQPLFFVGDGLMSAWPCKENEAKIAIERALLCAKKIIEEKSTRDDNEDLLSIHSIVSYGSCKFIDFQGVRNKKLLSFYGESIESLSLAAANKAPDQVLISSTALSKLSVHTKVVAGLNGAGVVIKFPETTEVPEKSSPPINEQAIAKIKEFAPITLSFPLSKERLEWSSEIRPVSAIFMQFPNEGKSENELEALMEMRNLVDSIALKVTKYEGLLNQIWMDEKQTQLLICFGPSPSAHVDNPERAVELGLELQQLLITKGVTGGIGIGTGKAYCGILGNDILRQHTVIGDVINLSARLAQESHGEVICDKTTHTSASRGVEFKNAVYRNIKGQAAPIETFTASTLKIEPISKNKSQKSIGREAELAVLEQAVTDTVHGQSAVFVIQGESGIGKSKLLSDVEAIAKAENCDFMNSACDFLSKASPYSIWGSIFSELLGMKSMDSGEDQKDIIEGVESKFGNRACLLNIVLKTKFSESQEVASMSSQQRVLATHDLLLEIITNTTYQKPLVIIIDDAQWIDITCWQLIKSVNERVNNILFVISIQKADKQKQIFPVELDDLTLIELNELTRESLVKLMCENLGVKSVSEDVSKLVDKIAKRNPFFSLEFVNSLQDEGLLVIEEGNCRLAKDAVINELSLPDSVHGAVRRRIDMLDQGSLLSLKVGSVVGRKFGKSIVKTIYPIAKERSSVPAYLDEARFSGFLNEALVDNSDGYFFNNATTADVAYDMTLGEQRRHLHQQSAEWYESHFAENLQPFHLRLAHHWENADNIIKASEYLEMESNRLLAAGFVELATQVGLRGINLFKLTIDKEPEKVGGMIGQTMGEIASVLGSRPIYSLADLGEINDPEIERLIVMLIHIGPTCHVSGRLDLFALMSVLALKNTLKHGNSQATADVYSMYAIVFRGLTGDSLGAYEWSKLALKIDKHYGGLVHSRVAHIHNWFLGHWVRPIEETYEINRIGAEAGAKHGDLVFECYNLASHIVFLATAGEHLDQIIKKGQAQFKILNRRVMHASFHIALEIQLAKALKGLTTANTELTDDEFNEQDDLAFLLDTPIDAQKGFYMVARIKILTHFGFWDEAVAWADRAFEVFPAIAGQVAEMEYDYYGAVSILYSAFYGKDAAKKKLLTRADASIDKMNSHAAAFAPNFEHKALLLEGIREGLFGEGDKALEILKNAVTIAKKSPFANDYALASEHLVRLEHRLEKSQTSIKESIEAWNSIGASAKANYMSQHFSAP